MPVSPAFRLRLHPYSALTALLIIFAAAVVLVAPTDYDYWWHLAAGRLIAEHGVPYVDPFSHTAFGKPWIDHEWAIDWLIYQLDRAFGYAGPMALFALILAATSLLVYRLVRDADAGRMPALVLLSVYLLLAAPTSGLRPQTLAPLGLAACALILNRARSIQTGASRRLIWLIPLLWLWTNLHGSYVIGIVLIAMHLIASVLTTGPKSLGIHGSASRTLLQVLFACIAVTLFNPYGWALWRLTLDYALVSGRNDLHFISEWRPPDFGQPVALVFLVTVLALAAAAVAQWRRGEHRLAGLADHGVAAVFAFMGFRATYHFPLYAVIALPLLGAAIALRMQKWSRSEDEEVSVLQGRWTVVVAISAGVMLIALMASSPQAQELARPHLDGKLP